MVAAGGNETHNKVLKVRLVQCMRLLECVCTLRGDQWHKECSGKIICNILHSRRLNNDCLMSKRMLCCTVCVCAALMSGKKGESRYLQTAKYSDLLRWTNSALLCHAHIFSTNKLYTCIYPVNMTCSHVLAFKLQMKRSHTDMTAKWQCHDQHDGVCRCRLCVQRRLQFSRVSCRPPQAAQQNTLLFCTGGLWEIVTSCSTTADCWLWVSTGVKACVVCHRMDSTGACVWFSGLCWVGDCSACMWHHHSLSKVLMDECPVIGLHYLNPWKDCLHRQRVPLLLPSHYLCCDRCFVN